MDFLNLDDFSKMFFYIGVISTTIYAIKLLIFTFAGSDTDIPDGHIDVDGTDTDTAFSFLSIQSILAFFMGFGWAGYACISAFDDFVYIFAVPVITGLFFMGLSAYLTYLMKSLNKRETFDMKTIVGTVGKAYSKIAPKSIGMIEIEINSKLTVTEAQNNSDEEIEAFKPVKVVDYNNNTIYIEKE